MTYRLVHQLQQKAIPVKQLCRVLQVSRAGYQHWQCSARSVDIVTTVHLKAAFSTSGGSYGSRRLIGPVPVPEPVSALTPTI